MDRQSKRMNDWIRAAAGHVPPTADPAADSAPKTPPTANAGNGAHGPAPDVETPSQRINKFIRRLAGRVQR